MAHQKRATPPRESTFGTGYVQLDWRRNLGADQDLAVSVSHTQEVYKDSYKYPLLLLNPKNGPALFGPNDFYTVDWGGKASNQTRFGQPKANKESRSINWNINMANMPGHSSQML